MGALITLLDTILFIYFLGISIVVPTLDAQIVLPSNIFPDVLVHLNMWYINEFGNYLVSEKPHFFVGITWQELVFAWPLCIASLYGIVAGKTWLPTICLIYGVDFLTALVAILSELVGSGKASDKLISLYSIFVGFAVLAVLRGLLPHFQKSNVTRLALVKKKDS